MSALLLSNPDKKFDGNTRALKGSERAALLLLLLGEKYGAPIWSDLDDDEIRRISIAMSHLGALEPEAIEMFMIEFVGQMSASGAMMGNFDNTERLLQTYLPRERVLQIMEEIRGPAGRKQVHGIGADEAAQRNFVSAAVRRSDEGADERRPIMPLRAPGAERDRIGRAPAVDDVVPGELVGRVDVAGLARAEVGTRGHQVGMLAARQAAQDFEIDPGLLPAAALGGADAARIARVVIFGD